MSEYVGRRIAIDEQVMSDLVAARLAEFTGDIAEHRRRYYAARDRMLADGHTGTSFALTIDRNRRAIDERASAIYRELAMVGREVCDDPDMHDRLEREAAQELRLPSDVPAGWCKWCGKARPEVGHV